MYLSFTNKIQLIFHLLQFNFGSVRFSKFTQTNTERKRLNFPFLSKLFPLKHVLTAHCQQHGIVRKNDITMLIFHFYVSIILLLLPVRYRLNVLKICVKNNAFMCKMVRLKFSFSHTVFTCFLNLVILNGKFMVLSTVWKWKEFLIFIIIVWKTWQWFNLGLL